MASQIACQIASQIACQIDSQIAITYLFLEYIIRIPNIRTIINNPHFTWNSLL